MRKCREMATMRPRSSAINACGMVTVSAQSLGHLAHASIAFVSLASTCYLIAAPAIALGIVQDLPDAARGDNTASDHASWNHCPMSVTGQTSLASNMFGEPGTSTVGRLASYRRRARYHC